MGDIGEFWRDVKEARKTAGLPARRRATRRAEPTTKTDKARFEKAGLVQKSEWHWQMRLAGDLLNFWPSKCKWQWRGKVQTGDWSELFTLIVEHS